MIKNIDIAQLRVGMYVARLDGGWLDHPFWKTSFAIANDTILQKLRSSGLSGCWIDTARGLDVEAADPALRVQPTEPRPVSPPDPLPELIPATATLPIAQALRAAALICDQSTALVSGLFDGARLHGTVDVASCDTLMEDMARSIAENPSALVGLLRLRAHDATSYRHSLAVASLMMAVAHAFRFDAVRARSMGMAGLVHDVGKVVLPSDVLAKPDRLSPEEEAMVHTHPLRGAELLARSREVDGAMLDVCLHHHEKVDGTGYPERLVSAQLSWEARACAICDVYDALTAVRPYKTSWDPAAAIAHMTSLPGHFDRELLAVMIKTLGAYPCGSLVRLDSGELAVVKEQNATAPYAPVVVVFYSTASNVHVTPHTIDLSHPEARVRVSAREPRERWSFPHLDTLWAGELASQ